MTSTSSHRSSGTTATRCIELRGVRVHNLKGIDLDIPLGQLVVLSGVSGSGKSSLAFDTLFAEGQRRYIESFSASARQYLERIERPNADRIAHVPPAIAIRSDLGRRGSFSRATVAVLAEIEESLRRLFARAGRVVCPNCRLEVRSHSAEDVVRAASELPSGTRLQLCFPVDEADEDSSPVAWRSRGFSRTIVGEHSRSLDELPNGFNSDEAWLVADRLVAGKVSSGRLADSAETALREGHGRCVLLIEEDASTAGASRIIDDRVWKMLRFSRRWECGACGREFLPPEPGLFEPESGSGCETCRDTNDPDCPTCLGSRLRSEALAVRIGELNIAEVLHQTSSGALSALPVITNAFSAQELSLTRLIRDDIDQRLRTVCDLGLGHLILNRRAETLSGGEARRLVLANAVGSRVTGTLCVVDEPSAGLHPSEMPLVIRALRQLQALRNSVIVVDHAPEVIEEADYAIDLGPGAGPQGGNIVFAGPPAKLSHVEASATGRAIHQQGNSPASSRAPRNPTDWLTLTNINHRNLRGLTVRLPLGVLCVVTGRGGSGKMSLVVETLYPAVRAHLGQSCEMATRGAFGRFEGGDSLVEAVLVDQSPLTRSSRSNAATWIEVFDEIRDVFAQTGEAKLRGFGLQHFSFNAAQGGRCRACRGTGELRHDMQFLPDVRLSCPECGGTRYRREILDVKYRSRSIADVLAMSAAEAATFFRNHPRLQGRLQMLKQIGLDYLVLGQPTETLSGGEAQRLKLAAHLTSSRGPTLIVCDEPTAGLHPADVSRLIACFDELLAIGHSLVLVDNSPHLIHAADHVIELRTVDTADGSEVICIS